MNWLREALSDSRSGRVSSKRIAMLTATVALAISVVVLSVAAILGYDVAGELASVAVPLAGLGGAGYVGGKLVEQRKASEQ